MKLASLKTKLLLIAAFGAIFYFLYLFFFSANTPETLTITKDNYLDTIKTINAKLPIMLDKETQLQNIALEGKVLVYNYILINKIKDEINIKLLSKKLKQEVKKTYCSNQDIMILFRKDGYTARYIYLDTHKTNILTLNISPKDCK